MGGICRKRGKIKFIVSKKRKIGLIFFLKVFTNKKDENIILYLNLKIN